MSDTFCCIQYLKYFILIYDASETYHFTISSATLFQSFNFLFFNKVSGSQTLIYSWSVTDGGYNLSWVCCHFFHIQSSINLKCKRHMLEVVLCLSSSTLHP